MQGIKIIICDNGNQSLLTSANSIIASNNNITIYKQKRNLGVAGSWNFLAREILRQHQYALILNDDVIIHKNKNQIAEFIQHNTADFIFAGYGCSSFILPKETYSLIGSFDENFYPAYYEDCDYERRVKVAGLINDRNHFLSAEVFRNSSSAQLNPELNKDYNLNKLRYIAKWGGLPYQEKFIKPFSS